jgi:hypothetical protein
MTRPLTLCATLLIASLATAAGAATHAATAAAAGATTHAATGTGATTHARHDGAAPPARPAGAPRRLDDIHIEGEIPVPQVLFITAREQRRFMEFQNARYLRSSRRLGEDTVAPDWIVVTNTRPTSSKEKSR